MQDAEGIGHIDSSNGIRRHAHLVGVTDETGQAGIGQVLDELPGVQGHAEYRRFFLTVQPPQHLLRAFIAHAQHNTVRMGEVLPAVALTQKFRVVRHPQLLRHFDSMLLQEWDDPLLCSGGRDGGLGDQNTEIIIMNRVQRLLHCAVQICKVRLSVLAVGRAHAVVHALAVRHRALPVSGGDKIFAQVPAQRLVQPRLQEGQLSGLDGVHPRLIDLNAVHLVAVLHKAQGRGQPHKAQTNYRYHISSSSLLSLMYSRKYRTPCSTSTWGW